MKSLLILSSLICESVLSKRRQSVIPRPLPFGNRLERENTRRAKTLRPCAAGGFLQQKKYIGCEHPLTFDRVSPSAQQSQLPRHEREAALKYCAGPNVRVMALAIAAPRRRSAGLIA